MSFEKQKRVTIADAEAYEKRTSIQANNGLEQKLNAYIEVQKAWADGFSKYQGNIVPTVQSGNAAGTGTNGATSFMEIMGAKAARDLALDLNTKSTNP